MPLIHTQSYFSYSGILKKLYIYLQYLASNLILKLIKTYLYYLIQYSYKIKTITITTSKSFNGKQTSLNSPTQAYSNQHNLSMIEAVIQILY